MYWAVVMPNDTIAPYTVARDKDLKNLWSTVCRLGYADDTGYITNGNGGRATFRELRVKYSTIYLGEDLTDEQVDRLLDGVEEAD